MTAPLSICLEDATIAGVCQRHYQGCDGPATPVPGLLMPGEVTTSEPTPVAAQVTEVAEEVVGTRSANSASLRADG